MVRACTERPDGRGYKAELVLRREESRTRKINLWFAPGLRDGASPKPHKAKRLDSLGSDVIRLAPSSPAMDGPSAPSNAHSPQASASLLP